jgi:hypothetical protein
MKNSNRIEVGGQGRTFSKRECSCYEASPGRFVVQLTVWPLRGAAEVDFYDVTPIPGAQFGRAAFRFVKAAALVERPAYSVLLDGDRSACDCPHGTYKAHQLGPCRHVLAAEALVKAGKLPCPRPAAKVVSVPARLDGKPVRVPAAVDAPAAQPPVAPFFRGATGPAQPPVAASKAAATGPAQPAADDDYCTDDDADGPYWGPDDVVSLVPAPAAAGGAA